MTLSLREPNQILASPQYKFPIESSQICHKTREQFLALFQQLLLIIHLLVAGLVWSLSMSFFQIIKGGGHDWCGVTSFVSVEQSIGVSAATSPGPGPLLAPKTTSPIPQIRPEPPPGTLRAWVPHLGQVESAVVS